MKEDLKEKLIYHEVDNDDDTDSEMVKDHV